MAEGIALLMRRTRKCTEGSNPPFSDYWKNLLFNPLLTEEDYRALIQIFVFWITSWVIR